MLARLVYHLLKLAEPLKFPSPSSHGHGKVPQQTPVISFPVAVYAHRGGPLASGALENTLPAFRHAAAALHVDLLELDVQVRVLALCIARFWVQGGRFWVQGGRGEHGVDRPGGSACMRVRTAGTGPHHRLKRAAPHATAFEPVMRCHAVWLLN